MGKLTKIQVDEIIKLNSEGKTCVELAEMFNVKQPTITYWTNENSRKKRILHSVQAWKNKSPEEKKKINSGRKEYLKNYMKNRYKTDEEFRNKQRERQRIYQKNKGEIIKENYSGIKE